MKKLFLLFLSIYSVSSALAAKFIVNQISGSGNTLNINVNIGDTILFNLSNSISIRQVSESTWVNFGTSIIAGGFSVSGSGQVAIVGNGPFYFVMVSSSGQISKGSISTNSVTSSRNIIANSENPVEAKIINDRLQINIKASNVSGLVSIHDILGNKIFEAPANDNNSLSMVGHKSGVYFVVWKDQKSSFTKRFFYWADN
jgi:hypothetical protein